MKWLFTGPHPLEAELLRRGHEVIARHQADEFPDLKALIAGGSTFTEALRATPDPDRTPDDYAIRSHLRAVDPDVLVITPMLQPGLGVPKGPVLRWANRGHRVIVGIGHDPGTIAAARANAWRGCSCNLHTLHVYVTNDAEAAASSAKQRRTVLLGNPDTLIRVVADAHAHRPYTAHRRAKPFI